MDAEQPDAGAGSLLPCGHEFVHAKGIGFSPRQMQGYLPVSIRRGTSSTHVSSASPGDIVAPPGHS